MYFGNFDNITPAEVEEKCNCAGILLIRPPNHDDNKNLQVLLVEGKRKYDRYSFPKGKRNKNEDSLTAAKRELYEETGITEDSYPEISIL